MIRCLHYRNIYTKRKLRAWRDQKCIPLVGAITPLICAGRQNTPSRLMRYRAKIGNLRKLGRIIRHGTVLPPRKYLYQKEATGMERPEMYFASRCNNSTYLCGPSKYPVSREAVKGLERKVAKIGTDLSPRYCACTKKIFITKGSYGHGETRSVFH